MNPYLIGAETLLSAVPEITKILGGNKELKEAEQLAKIKRPEYRIPEAATEALNRAKYRALATTLPGQNLMEQKIGAATGSGIRYATETAASPTDALATASGMIGNQQNALGDLSIAAANMYDKNQQILGSELNQYAGWQEKKQNWDILDPYTAAKQKEAALRKYGAENKQRGIEGLFGSMAMGVDLLGKSGVFDKGYGKSPTDTTMGVGGFSNNKSFGGIDVNTPEAFGGLSNQQKIQQFKLKYGRYPMSHELGQTDLGFYANGLNKNPYMIPQ